MQLNRKKSLTLYLFLKQYTGINTATALTLCYKEGFNPLIDINKLTNNEIIIFKEHIEKNYIVNFKLKQEVQSNIKKLINIKCYRGRRHLNGFPTRGQRTKSNAKTCKKFFKIFKSNQKKKLNKKIIHKPKIVTKSKKNVKK
jgi:small subunit ribosomal protein S13